jgi:hypothetical protein
MKALGSYIGYKGWGILIDMAAPTGRVGFLGLGRDGFGHL